MADINEMLRKITPHQDTDGYVMVTAEADDWRMLREYIAGLSAEVDAHSDLFDQSDRIEALEALVIQYRDDLRHPVTDQDTIDRRLAAVSALLSESGTGEGNG